MRIVPAVFGAPQRASFSARSTAATNVVASGAFVYPAGASSSVSSTGATVSSFTSILAEPVSLPSSPNVVIV